MCTPQVYAPRQRELPRAEGHGAVRFSLCCLAGCLLRGSLLGALRDRLRDGLGAALHTQLRGCTRGIGLAVRTEVRAAARLNDSLDRVIKGTKCEGARMLIGVLRDLRADRAQSIPLDMKQASYFSFPKPEDVREFRKRGHRML